jgi:hypothetical protein
MSTDEPISAYSIHARTCIKGEAFFGSLIADYAIPHHISGQTDIGTDYLCEWTFGDRPTGVLFGVQVKSFTVTDKNRPRHEGVATELNGLLTYRIPNPNLKIEEKNINHWKGLGLPFYLFAAAITKESAAARESFDLYYKRFTPVMTLGQDQDADPYYKVNRDAKFIAFLDDTERRQGFARDLYIDLMRWQYYKGSIAYINPRKLGLLQFPEEARVFRDLFKDYKEQVCTTYAKTKAYLDANCDLFASPTAPCAPPPAAPG